jgi:hypothetical protein
MRSNRHRTPACRAIRSRRIRTCHGIYIMESVYLEHLARERVYEFVFVALPT